MHFTIMRKAVDEQANIERYALLDAHPPWFSLNLSRARGEPPAHAKLRPISCEDYQVLIPGPHTGLPKPRRAQQAASSTRCLVVSSMLTLSLFFGLFILYRNLLNRSRPDEHVGT